MAEAPFRPALRFYSENPPQMWYAIRYGCAVGPVMSAYGRLTLRRRQQRTKGEAGTAEAS